MQGGSRTHNFGAYSDAVSSRVAAANVHAAAGSAAAARSVFALLLCAKPTLSEFDKSFPIAIAAAEHTLMTVMRVPRLRAPTVLMQCVECSRRRVLMSEVTPLVVPAA